MGAGASAGAQIKEPKIPGQTGMSGMKTAGKVIRPPFRGSESEKIVFKIIQRINRETRAAVNAAKGKRKPGAKKLPVGEKLKGRTPPESGTSLYNLMGGALPTAGLGAITGGIAGAGRFSSLSKKKREALAQESGPIGRFAVENPGTYGALLGAVSMPLVLRSRTLPGALAAGFGPGAGMAGLNYLLARRAKAKKTPKSK
jgi:hypothetical protein